MPDQNNVSSANLMEVLGLLGAGGLAKGMVVPPGMWQQRLREIRNAERPGPAVTIGRPTSANPSGFMGTRPGMGPTEMGASPESFMRLPPAGPRPAPASDSGWMPTPELPRPSPNAGMRGAAGIAGMGGLGALGALGGDTRDRDAASIIQADKSDQNQERPSLTSMMPQRSPIGPSGFPSMPGVATQRPLMGLSQSPLTNPLQRPSIGIPPQSMMPPGRIPPTSLPLPSGSPVTNLPMMPPSRFGPEPTASSPPPFIPSQDRPVTAPGSSPMDMQPGLNPTVLTPSSGAPSGPIPMPRPRPTSPPPAPPKRTGGSSQRGRAPTQSRPSQFQEPGYFGALPGNTPGAIPGGVSPIDLIKALMQSKR